MRRKSSLGVAPLRFGALSDFVEEKWWERVLPEWCRCGGCVTEMHAVKGRVGEVHVGKGGELARCLFCVAELCRGGRGSTERNLETCLDRVDGVGQHHDRSLREGRLDHRRYSLLGRFAMPCCFWESRPGFC